MSSAQPTVREMCRQAVEALGGATTNTAVKNWVQQKYPGTKTNTIQCQLIAATVNHDSRIHYGVATKPRLANDPNGDIFYRPATGQVELYDPATHGSWEIYEKSDGRLGVRIVEATIVDPVDVSGSSFAAEAHLRDYLALHLDEIEPGLQLYVGEGDKTGVEFITPIGRIDILAIDKDDCFVVIELKVSKGPDAVAGQIFRYKNWVKKHLAAGKPVRGIIIAQHITDKIRYAICDDPEVSAREYEIQIKLKSVAGL
ncbi:endonuclease NucS domain-containing protein [Aeoliella sp. SH292]|uniref:endonuclease NucS domain-containing protein n=1 Tax=Aeoliella sp. SH292 TaxID=3454464 RepID=UPI003F958CDD